MPAYFRCTGNPLVGTACSPEQVEVQPLPTLCAECDGSAEGVLGRVGALAMVATDTTVVDTTIIVGWSMDPTNEDRTLPVFWWGGAGAGVLFPSLPGQLPLPAGYQGGMAHAVESVALATTENLRVVGVVSNADDTAAAVWTSSNGGRSWQVSTLEPTGGHSFSVALAIRPPVNCRVPPCPQQQGSVAGVSYTSSTNRIATLWEEGPGPGTFVVYDLNAVTEGLPAGLVLREATSIAGSDSALTIAGWGTQPGSVGADDSVAWVIKRKPATAGVGEKRFETFALRAAPNPLRSAVAISYALPHAARVRLTVHDIAGREVAKIVDGPEAAGEHQQVWRGSGVARGRLPAGVYMVRLAYGSVVQTTKVVLQR